MPERPQSIAGDAVSIDDDFWDHWRGIVHDEMVDYQYEQLRESGTLENFRRASAGESGDHNGMWFQDSDAYKWIEAASYVLENRDDSELESHVDEVIELIAAAQEDDGYLNTYFALEEPEKRWTNLNTMHELYCAGHLIEAAVAHYRATGEESLLDVAIDFADHIEEVFGDEIDGAPGHQEIELALMRLAEVTDEDRYRELATYFVDVRGNTDRFAWEHEHRDEIATLEFEDEADEDDEDEDDEDGTDWDGPEVEPFDASYNQAHAPLREQEAVEGHSVRAVYYFAGATDVAVETDDGELLEHLESLWDNMTKRRMYVTGGIGSQHPGERFTTDYHLPNDTAYAETCAAIGSIFWSQRLFEATGDARYHDLIERQLYNATIVGASLDGTEYFYDNPLESDGDRHREGWFECACCPPNLARLLASLERYVYATDDEGLYVNQYVGGTAEFTIDDTTVAVTQDAAFPWDGDVEIDVSAAAPASFALRLRIPGWAEEASVTVDGDPVALEAGEVGDGGDYLTIDREWADATVSVSFPMPGRSLVAHPAVEADAGRIALARGPLVYCLEGVDHDRPLAQHAVDPTTDFTATDRDDLLGGVVTLEGEATVPDLEGWDDALYRPAEETETTTAPVTAVPYYAWDNREPGEMRVWIRRD